MAKKKKKFYVVWKGREIGVFDNWDKCKELVSKFDGALFKSFETEHEATDAFKKNPWISLKADPKPKKLSPEEIKAAGLPIENSIAVDGACNMVSGQMEYRGVYVGAFQELFRQGPYAGGSNNIGEFLAIVHALAWCNKKKIDLPIYTDSKTAIAWVRNKHAKTKVQQTAKNQELFILIERAEQWLKTNTWQNKILKWNTEYWGEIPADFGRK
jgi:ribonuclease HI